MIVDDATIIITDGMYIHKGQPIITTEVVVDDSIKIIADGMYVHKGQPIITTEIMDH